MTSHPTCSVPIEKPARYKNACPTCGAPKEQFGSESDYYAHIYDCE